ncbi:bacterial Ig-like domain-containing protein [Peloplasma aerotolerans]|uniref:Bacterial Ig-like domain-containing protein n=1 Tax=Peloplasma aerotolerans TaxID=3044389 RepID=A0AAW6U9M7_9MOLU|nr:bacterial Ig-like domain-containing protein [Mariniplasma sp. M4Ah]MDI6453425.1 bacterial Ig-like domain-containing protein [Mariniplasma sp. M4Ah]MDR4968260.1 bacterial Ig-like domain-containing protein [Acholeplasmataceae bacterium]
MRLPKFVVLALFIFVFLLSSCVDDGAIDVTPTDEPIVSTPVETPQIVILDHIEIYVQPAKIVYDIDEPLDISGMKIRATYSDETVEIVDIIPSMLSNFDFSTTGEKAITVSYTFNDVIKTTTFVVTVSEEVVLDGPGYKGEIVSLKDTLIEGMFGGLIIYQINHQRNFMGGGTRLVVDLKFPEPYLFGADYYTLEYYDLTLDTWHTYMQNDEPVTSDYDNFSLSFSEPMTLRLKTSGVDGGELTSNVVETDITFIETSFSGWSLDQSSYISGVMSPYVGYGLTFDITVYDISDTESILVEGGYSFEWYRLNPYTYEMTRIDGADEDTYITTTSDIGHYIVSKAVGDEINVGGYLQVLSMETVQVQTEAVIVEVGDNGFTIGFDYLIDIENSDTLTVYTDQGNTELEITSITQGSNAAIYVVEVDLTGLTEITIYAFGDSWVLVSPFMDMHMQWGMQVDLTE